MAHLIICRGLPGSGKSTFANTLKGSYTHYEAVMYFINEYGDYNFDVTKLGNAHDWCFNGVFNALKNGENVIVTNTFSRHWEYERYATLANIFHNLHVSIITMNGSFKNIHGVPDSVVQAMRNRWQH